MATIDPNEAVVRFVELLRSTVGCVTEVPVIALPTDSDTYHIILYNGHPALLRTRQGTPNLKLSIVHHCHPIPHPTVADTFVVRSIYYAYEILDVDENEILTYHWHPAGESDVTTPHLHLSSKIGPIRLASSGRTPSELYLANLHISTGRILLEDVVRLLITDFNVAALTTNWERTLFENAEESRAHTT